MAATQTQLRRGTTSQTASFTGALGEVTVDTDRDGLVVHDGSTAGGFITPTASESQKQTHRYADGGGTGDAVTVSLTPAPAAYAAGLKIKWKQPANNTGAATINVNSLGTKSIVKNVSDALSANDLLEDGIYEATYDGTNFQLANAVGVSAGTTLLMVKELTSQSTADFTGVFSASLYGDYELRGWMAPATNGVKPYLQYSVDGGSNYSASGYGGQIHDHSSQAFVGVGSDGAILPGSGNPTSQSNGTNAKFEFRFRLGDLGQASAFRQLAGEVAWVSTEGTNKPYGGPIWRKWSTSTAVNGLRMKFSSGNIATCWIGLYGFLRA